MSPTTLLRLTTRSLRINSSISRLSQTPHLRTSPPALRPFSTTLPTLHPRKGAEDKDSINRESTEYTRSGTDDAAASDPEAFNPSTTEPKSEREEGKQDGKSNLDVSPANTDVSKQRDTTEGGAERSPGEEKGGERNTGHGGPKKGKKI